MSKQLKPKRSLLKKSPRIPESYDTKPGTAVESEVSEPHFHAQVEAITDSVTRAISSDPQTESSSVKVEVTSELLPPDHEMSCLATDSGVSSEIGVKLPRTLSKPKSTEAVFDDDILFALAEADADARMREELAFRAILRSVSM